jgi:hypothetical protein
MRVRTTADRASTDSKDLPNGASATVTRHPGRRTLARLLSALRDYEVSRSLTTRRVIRSTPIAATVSAPQRKERHDTQQTHHHSRRRSRDTAHRSGDRGLRRRWRRDRGLTVRAIEDRDLTVRATEDRDHTHPDRRCPRRE